jgi:hypothetical protein
MSPIVSHTAFPLLIIFVLFSISSLSHDEACNHQSEAGGVTASETNFMPRVATLNNRTIITARKRTSAEDELLTAMVAAKDLYPTLTRRIT